MSATAVQTEKPEKFLVRNQTAGYVGVMEINPRTGEESGVNIEPFGTRWMTEEEMVATARAPRKPEDNPFVEQPFLVQDPESQKREEHLMRPLVLDSGERYVPGQSDRYVPTQDALKETAASVPPVQQAPAPTPQFGKLHVQGTPTPPSEEQDAESWVAPPQAPGEVLGGALQGSDEPVREQAPGPQATDHPGDRYVPPTQAAVQTPGAVEEEHAAVDPEIGEETGQARSPAQAQPEGEYAQAEEVGSPDAPRKTSGNDETLIGG